MTKIAACICGVAAMTALTTVSAEEFPLTFKTIPAKEVMAFPGGSGSFLQLRLAKPSDLKKEPKAISKHPLYGSTGQDEGPGFLLRLDESKGDGKGYDTVLIDMNQNGDLTDETAGARIQLPKQSREASFFGPFQVPAEKAIAGGRPLYFAQIQVYNTELFNNEALKNVPNMTFGYARFKAGWYLETTVRLGGVEQKVGVFDANSNARLGDFGKAQSYKSDDQESWYFSQGDSFLMDANKSGAFQSDAFGSEFCPLASVLYLGATPYQATLVPDCKTLRVEPWSGPLASVSLTPKGEQVRSLSLAFEKTKGTWQIVRVGVDGGKVQVPPGNYRVFASTLLGKGQPKDQIMVSGYQRVVKTPFAFSADKPNTLKVGAPLDIQVTAERKTPQAWETSRLATKAAGDSDYVLSINAHVAGTAGEVYSSFGKGENFEDDPPKPAFSVVDASGKTVGNGNLEFG